MSATKILWGQVLVVFLIVLAAVWGATQWVAWRLGYQAQLGQPMDVWAGVPVYLRTGRSDLPDWSPPRYARWRLDARRCLNPGSVGGPVFHLELTPEPGEDACSTRRARRCGRSGDKASSARG